MIELPLRHKTEEGRLILEKVAPQEFCVALAVEGTALSTPMLAKKLESWQCMGKGLTFIIGGTEGLDEAVLTRAAFHWSLSPLTFPHQLVKVLLAEQLYRAVSLLQGHPYHRA